MAEIVPMRINDTWVRITGELINPRNIFIVDKIGKNLVGDLSAAGVSPCDQIVTFTNGSFANIKSFLALKAREYNEVKAVIFLWLGQEEISKESTSQEKEKTENQLLMEGVNIIPNHDVNKVVDLYSELVKESLLLLPNADIYTSDAAPRRSPGFAITHANYIFKKMTQQNERHHHFALNKHFHGRRSGSTIGKPGGRFPLNEHYFEHGIYPTLDAWAAVIRRSYAAMNLITNPDEMDSTLLASSKLVYVRF